MISILNVLKKAKLLIALVMFLFVITATAHAETEATVSVSDISFKSNKDLIVSLRRVLEKDYGPEDLKKALTPFNAKSEGFRAKSTKELFDALPLASNDLLVSARNLGLLKNPKTLVDLQNEIYLSAVKVITPQKFSKKAVLGAGGALLGVAALTGGSKASAKPSVTITSSSSSIAENGGTSTLTISLSKAAAADIAATLSFSSTATLATDFSAVQTVTITKGATSGTVTVTSIDDSVYEGNETLTATISSISMASYVIGSASSTSVSITEDETVPTVSLSASGTTVSEEGGGGITFTATIDQIAASNLVVSLNINIASRNQAYVSNLPTSLDVTISAGSLSGTATYVPTNNNSYDDTSTVNFNIASVSGSGAIGSTVLISSTLFLRPAPERIGSAKTSTELT